ncbi:MAG: hypothetical protein QM722_22000 [Piscinibacter sp.]
MRRLALARTLAWALLMSGWIVLTHLADRYAAGPVAAFALVAAWLLALGLAATLAARLSANAWLLRALLLGCALVAARGLLNSTHGGGLAALWPVAIAWALLVALASATVRGLRQQLPRRASAPVLPAASGALLAALLAGDAADSASLALRMAGALLLVALGLVVLQPAAGVHTARAGCRAGLFDCALPAWPAGGWREPARWPLLIAMLVMLPMMAGLSQMLALCRAGGASAQALLGAHLAAMFLPALLWPAGRAPAWRRAACAGLLVLGGLLLWMAGTPGVLWAMLAHGAAWSLAWSAQLDDPSLRASAHSAAWRAALLQALFALALGVALGWAGPPALQAVHGALAAAAALAVGMSLLRPLPSLRVRSRCR